MSHYMTATETTTHFNASDSDKIVSLVKRIAREYAPEYNYGWRDSIEKTENIYDLTYELSITPVFSTDCENITPVLTHAYPLAFFPTMLEAVAPYMSDGYIKGQDTDNGSFIITFKDGKAAFKWLERESLMEYTPRF